MIKHGEIPYCPHDERGGVPSPPPPRVNPLNFLQCTTHGRRTNCPNVPRPPFLLAETNPRGYFPRPRPLFIWRPGESRTAGSSRPPSAGLCYEVLAVHAVFLQHQGCVLLCLSPPVSGAFLTRFLTPAKQVKNPLNKSVLAASAPELGAPGRFYCPDLTIRSRRATRLVITSSESGQRGMGPSAWAPAGLRATRTSSWGPWPPNFFAPQPLSF